MRSLILAFEKQFSGARISDDPRSALAASCSAKCLEHALFLSRWMGVTVETLLIFIRSRQDRQEVGKRCEILPRHCGFKNLFDAVVARDIGRVDASHGPSAFARIGSFARQS